MANGIFERLAGDYRAANPYDQGMISAALAGGRPDPQLDLIRQILHGIRGRKVMPEVQAGPADPLAALGILDPSQQPSFEPQGPTFRPSAVSNMLPALGEVPQRPRPQAQGGMDDTRFMGPRGEQAPAVDFGGAVLPTGPGPRREPPVAAEMDPQRRLELMKAARMFREGGGQFRNVTGESEVWLRGGPPEDRSVFAEDLRADEERLRRGDFENPRSPASRMAQQMFSQLTGQEAPPDLSAAAIMSISPVFDQMIRNQIAGESQNFQQAMSLLREERALRGEERTRRGEERAEESLDMQREQLDMRKKPTPAQAEKMAQMGNTLQSLERLIGEKADQNTGPILNAFEEAMTFIGASEFGGYDLSQKNAFKANVHDMLAQYMQSISGQAISEAEAIRLQRAFPKVSDDDKTFVAKARNAIQRLAEKREQYLGTLEAAGKDVSAFRRPGGAVRADAGAQGGVGPAGSADLRRGQQPGTGQVWVARGKDVRGPVSREEAQRMLQAGEIDRIVD